MYTTHVIESRYCNALVNVHKHTRTYAVHYNCRPHTHCTCCTLALAQALRTEGGMHSLMSAARARGGAALGLSAETQEILGWSSQVCERADYESVVRHAFED